MRAHQVVIVCGETGSGKTTQLPKIALQLGRGLGRGRPRPDRPHAAAPHRRQFSVAKRIAQELNSPLGEVVGYKVRFQDRLQPGASVKLMTDGILLAETQSDPLLRAYDTLIIDEAHERSLNIDFLLGYLRQMLPRRPDLKVVVTSATIDADRFANHFAVHGRAGAGDHGVGPAVPGGAALAAVRGDAGLRPRRRHRRRGRRAVARRRPGRHPGLPARRARDPRRRRPPAQAPRRRRSRRPAGRDPAAVRAAEPAPSRSACSSPATGRRIVLATNVAETSLTVPGIRYVIDSGLARVKRYS